MREGEGRNAERAERSGVVQDARVVSLLREERNEWHFVEMAETGMRGFETVAAAAVDEAEAEAAA